ncbi:MAG: paraquat-inducible protein A [Gammaproteobacteria bacterium]
MHAAHARAAMVLLAGLLMLVFSGLALQAAWSYEASSAEMAALMDADEKLDELTERTLEILSLGFYESAKHNGQRLEQLNTLRQSQADETLLWTLCFLAAVALAMCMALWAPDRRKALGVITAWSSVPALIVGIAAPILVIVAYKELPVLGETVLKIDSKGIASSVDTLFRTGNAVVALIILLFSILFPALKTFTLIAATIPDWRGWVGLPMHWLHVLGRWSMADVFVVALLLTYFVADKSDVTRAEVQTGFYFFLSYVLLSQIATWALDREPLRSD